jgi:UDP-glucose 4-epimerase
MTGTRRRVLVTGVAGFIGSNLACRLLEEGFDVTGIDDLSQGMEGQVPGGVDFHRLDVRSPSIQPLFQGIDAVFHLAAKNCIPDCQRDPVTAASINIVGTVNVFESARQAGVRRVIHAESSALYEGIAAMPTNEDRVAPRSMYALTKHAGSTFADAYARYHGMNTTALRYFCVYGPRQDYRRTVPPVMSAFIIRLLRGERPTIYGTGEKRRDFVYVDDVNDFHVRCLDDARTQGGTFNIGSGTNHSVSEILQEVQSLLGTRIEPEYAADQPGEAEHTQADISRAAALGWIPRVGLRAGLQHSIAYIREHVPLAARAGAGRGLQGGRPGAAPPAPATGTA